MFLVALHPLVKVAAVVKALRSKPLQLLVLLVESGCETCINHFVIALNNGQFIGIIVAAGVVGIGGIVLTVVLVVRKRRSGVCIPSPLLASSLLLSPSSLPYVRYGGG